MKSNHLNESLVTIRDVLFFFFRSGQEVQKINAIENLKLLLIERKNDTLNKFVSCIEECLQESKEEIHIVASRCFCDVAECQVLSGSVYAKSLLPIILQNINSDNLGK